MNHRKLTEREMYRMVNICASAPLLYIPKVDDALIKLGLIVFWDNTNDAVEHNSSLPFYKENGCILPEWYDFNKKS